MLNRPAPIKVNPTCNHCGAELAPGGTAILCAPGGAGIDLPLPRYCTDRQCRKERDEIAIERAVAAGTIRFGVDRSSTETCALCGRGLLGGSGSGSQRYCHPDPPEADCYRLVTVYHWTEGSWQEYMQGKLHMPIRGTW